MSFIGVVCESKNENYIKQILSKILKKEQIIVFNSENINNMKNIKFETIIIFSKNEKILFKKEVMKNIISNAKYLIINADEEITLDILENMDLKVITYGFNSKSTITTSSVDEENVLICIQRNIESRSHNILEPQEISIVKQTPKTPTATVMGIGTLCLLYDIKQFKI